MNIEIDFCLKNDFFQSVVMVGVWNCIFVCVFEATVVSKITLSLCLQYSQAANTMTDVSECEQAKELGAINSTLRQVCSFSSAHLLSFLKKKILHFFFLIWRDFFTTFYTRRLFKFA